MYDSFLRVISIFSREENEMLWRVIICLVLTGIHVTVAVLSVERIKNCVNKKLSEKKYRKAKEKNFSLFYGHSGVEAFNAFSQYDMKQIEYLAECVQSEDSSFYLPT
jgi:hypothetical protein